MTLFTLLLVFICERLFKTGERWQFDSRMSLLFKRVTSFSLTSTLVMTILSMFVVYLIIETLDGLLFNFPLLIFWVMLSLLCIGAGQIRLHYHAYLNAADQGDANACEAMASELTLIHGIQPDCSDKEQLRELQNALLWINFRFYMAPLFWLVIGGEWGPVLLVGYAFLRAWQTWLIRFHTPHERLRSGIESILHVLDWLPVRLVGFVYALLGQGEKALPAWFVSLTDRHISPYQVLSELAQYSLALEPHYDSVKTPKAAVSMAKKSALVIIAILSLLTIYGALM